MKHNWHTKHFTGAFKTFKRSGTLFAIAPLGIVVGMGALIDSTIIMLQVIFTSPPVPNLLENIPTIGVLIVIAIISMIAQNIVIMNTYKSASMKKMPRHMSLRPSFGVLPASIAIHLATFTIAIIVIFGFSELYSIVGVNIQSMMQVVISILAGGLLMTLFTFKTLTLHSVVGAGKPLQEAVNSTVKMFQSSIGLIVEHNVVLFMINILALIVIFTITSILMLVMTAIGLTASQFFGGTSSMFVTTAITTFANLVMLGALMLYNMAAWSEMTRNLRRRAIPSAIRHLAKSYLSF